MKMAPGWFRLLEPEFQKKYMLNLEKFLQGEYANTIVFPEKKHIFRALDLVDYDDVNVVIISQDPYHESNQANGLAFAVNSDIEIPPSLRNIFKEIYSDIGEVASDRTLVSWANQGVLLLNSVLTVEESRPGSHRFVGWEKFTDKVVQLLNEKEEPIVFLLWGNYASSKGQYITNKQHLVLRSSHPSPLASYRGFSGCKHFSKTNIFLMSTNSQPIKWGV